MDSDFILDQMHLQAEPFALCELNGRCDLGLGQDSTATLHLVLAGEGEVVLPGAPAIPVSRGALVVVPALKPHVLRSFGSHAAPLPSCRPPAQDLAHLIHGEGGHHDTGLMALCAHFRLSLHNMDNVLDLIRAPLVENIADDPDLSEPVARILSELTRPALGSQAMIRVLLLQAMIVLLRRQMLADGPGTIWMHGLKDARLWPVLSEIMSHPGKAHSLESLAALAGMSRSVLAERFATAYGRGPMELLRDIRMRKAAQLLRDTDLPVKRISDMVGFRSRTAFTRAFEAATGHPPREFRKVPDA